MVSRITNRTPHEEASAETRTFDVLRWIRARRLQWVGHILRMNPDRMVHKALRHISENRSEGDLLMDVPDKFSWNELKALTSNRDGWRQRVQALRKNTGVTIVMSDSLPGRLTPRHCNRFKSLGVPPTVTSPSARKYVTRDAHEMFFRPRLGGKRKPRHQQHQPKKRGKSPSMTNKQRAAWALAHYQLHHGSERPTNEEPSLTWSPPEILGHHQTTINNVNETIMSPPTVRELFQFFEDQNSAHDNLHDLSKEIYI